MVLNLIYENLPIYKLGRKTVHDFYPVFSGLKNLNVIFHI